LDLNRPEGRREKDSWTGRAREFEGEKASEGSGIMCGRKGRGEGR